MPQEGTVAMRGIVSPSFARDLDALYRVGTLGGLSDRELLGRFSGRPGAEADRAFEAIVDRYGSLVLAVCRRAISDEQIAEDAFQATFLVLALKAGSIRRRESLGPWLHGVAARIARRARAQAARRARESLDLRFVRTIPAKTGGGEVELAELRAALDEEIERLPAAYRRAVVLCYLEGKTQEAAALELGWTKGTVSGRLARARDLLRARLRRRGFAPSAGMAGILFAGADAMAAVPSELARAAARAGLHVSLGRAETIGPSGSAAVLASGMLRTMMLGKLMAAVTAVVMVIAVATLLAQTGIGPAGSGGDRRVWTQDADRHQPAASARISGAWDPGLPRYARARLGTTRLRHSDVVFGVAFAPDGRTLASAGADGAVRFWDRFTGGPAASPRTIREKGKSPNVVAYSPDGTRLAIGRDGFVQIWDIVADKERARSPIHPGRVSEIVFAPDGRTLATTGSADSRVRIWDADTGQLRRSFALDVVGLYPKPLAFSRDGKLLAMAGTPRLPGGRTRVPDGDLIGIWKLDRDGEPLIIREAHEGWLFSLAFTPEGTLISSGCRFKRPADPSVKNQPWDGFSQIRVWDATSGRRIKDLDLDGTPGMCQAALSRDGRTLVSSHRDRVLIWEMPSGKLARAIPVDSRQDQVQYRAIAISPDGRTIAAARGDRAVHLWDVATGKPLFSDHEVGGVAFSPDGRLVATGMVSRSLLLWDANRGEVVHRLGFGGVGYSFALSFAPDGRTLAAAFVDGDRPEDFDHNIVRVWDLPGRTLRHELRVDHETVRVEFSPDGRRLAVASWDIRRQFNNPVRGGQAQNKDTIGVFDVATGKRVVGLPGHDKRVLAMLFGRDGKTLASAGQDNAIRLWDLETGRMLQEIPIKGHRYAVPPDGPGRTSWIGSAAISADLETAVSSRPLDDRLLIWDLRTGRVRRTIQTEAYDWGALAVSPDGRLLAWAMKLVKGPPGSSIRILDMNTKRELLRLEPGETVPFSLAFSADGKSMVSAMNDATALVWDLSAACSAAGRPRAESGDLIAPPGR